MFISHMPLEVQKKFIIQIIILLFLMTSLSSCKSVPITGRSQFMMISESEELALGETAYQQTLEKEPLSTDSEKVALIKRVGERIAAVSGRTDYQWEFNLIEKDIPNAFALPGGGEKPSEFLSTHPSGRSRVAHIRSLLPKALPLFEQSRP